LDGRSDGLFNRCRRLGKHGKFADRETRRFIDAELAQGKSEKSILTAGLAPKWGSWGEGFINEENWLKTLSSAQK